MKYLLFIGILLLLSCEKDSFCYQCSVIKNTSARYDYYTGTIYKNSIETKSFIECDISESDIKDLKQKYETTSEVTKDYVTTTTTVRLKCIMQ